MRNYVNEMPADVAISLHIQNLMETYGEAKIRNSLKELFSIEVGSAGSAVDKIVLSSDKDRCVVHLVNGMSLHFNFFKMGMTYFEGLAWLEGVLSGQSTEQQSAKAA